jgi:hypothetical protein
LEHFDRVIVGATLVVALRIEVTALEIEVLALRNWFALWIEVLAPRKGDDQPEYTGLPNEVGLLALDYLLPLTTIIA